MLLFVLFNISAFPARRSILGNIMRPHLLLLACGPCTSPLKQSGNLKASCESGVYCWNKASKHEWVFFFFPWIGDMKLHRCLTTGIGPSRPDPLMWCATTTSCIPERTNMLTQKGIINPDYSSTRLLNIHTVFHLFPFTQPPAHQANMVAIMLTLSRKHVSWRHASVFFSKVQRDKPLIWGLNNTAK